MSDGMDSGQFSQILLAIGNLQGAQTAQTAQLAQMHGDYIRMAADIEHKHVENQRAMDELKKEQTALHTTHSTDDNRRFRRLDKLIWFGAGALAVLQIIFGLWLKG